MQCHVDPGRHIVTNELFPMVSAMLTARSDGNIWRMSNDILGLTVLVSMTGWTWSERPFA